MVRTNAKRADVTISGHGALLIKLGDLHYQTQATFGLGELY